MCDHEEEEDDYGFWVWWDGTGPKDARWIGSSNPNFQSPANMGTAAERYVSDYINEIPTDDAACVWVFLPDYGCKFFKLEIQIEKCVGDILYSEFTTR